MTARMGSSRRSVTTVNRGTSNVIKPMERPPRKPRGISRRSLSNPWGDGVSAGVRLGCRCREAGGGEFPAEIGPGRFVTVVLRGDRPGLWGSSGPSAAEGTTELELSWPERCSGEDTILRLDGSIKWCCGTNPQHTIHEVEAKFLHRTIRRVVPEVFSFMNGIPADQAAGLA